MTAEMQCIVMTKLVTMQLEAIAAGVRTQPVINVVSVDNASAFATKLIAAYAKFCLASAYTYCRICGMHVSDTCVS
jgi:hypothetical protein